MQPLSKNKKNTNSLSWKNSNNKDNFDEEEHAEEIDYYLNFLEEPETLYTFTEKTINLFKSFIHEN